MKADDFVRAVNDVRPSLIRIEADEVTYNLHILIRFELERALLDGNLQAADLPRAWNEKYQQYLGVTPPDNRDGVLQDVHWSARADRLFPHLRPGQPVCGPILCQGRRRPWRPGGDVRRRRFSAPVRLAAAEYPPPRQRYTAAELVERVTGRPLSAGPLVEHLRNKIE